LSGGKKSRSKGVADVIVAGRGAAGGAPGATTRVQARRWVGRIRLQIEAESLSLSEKIYQFLAF
jgi:hypothetical protein